MLLDLELQVGTKAGDHVASHGARDLLARRLARGMVLLNEEHFVKGLCVGVGLLCHKVSVLKVEGKCY